MRLFFFWFRVLFFLRINHQNSLGVVVDNTCHRGDGAEAKNLKRRFEPKKIRQARFQRAQRAKRFDISPSPYKNVLRFHTRWMIEGKKPKRDALKKRARKNKRAFFSLRRRRHTHTQRFALRALSFKNCPRGAKTLISVSSSLLFNFLFW